LDIDNAKYCIEVPDRVTIAGADFNGREVEEMIQAIWKHELAVQVRLVRGELSDHFERTAQHIKA
jgi:hypothetical protein